MQQILKEFKDEADSDDDGENEDEAEVQRGYESEEDDKIEEPHGIKGMTLQLIELLTTLVQRPNVQEVVKQSLSPLLMTVSSYMIIEYSDHRQYKIDEHYFLHDKTNTIFKVRNIMNQCVDLFSSLIEIFGDQAIRAILDIVADLMEIPKKKSEEEDPENVVPTEILTTSIYLSKNAQHGWKRKDVAMILVGLFIEDLQMFTIRNPDEDLVALISAIVKLDFGKSGSMSSYLKGRSLWCASTCSEALITPTKE